MMRKILLGILFIICIVSIKTPAYAEGNSFVTIVNPQRISTYNKNYLASFREEWSQVQRRNLPATWPVTYDVLTKNDFVVDLKKMDDKQELGIFLEVTPDFAKAAHVSYNKTSSWHYATSLFLSGYSQNDRKKLIDTVFKKFKEVFGYYPKSVGGWWVDSYSLSYMQKKYGITGVLGVSDQYDLDSYSVWGTWWSVPYYPSKINAALPAQNLTDKLPIVTFRWAARDPLYGYDGTGARTPSIYSLQDYHTIGLPISYYQKLLETFALQSPYDQFGQATVGLEGDLPLGNYQNEFAQQLQVVQNLEQSGTIKILTMQQFSSWYNNAFPDLSPSHIIVAQDLLGKSARESIWVQHPSYRLNVIYDAATKKTEIRDFRMYPENLTEPYYKSPNKQFTLSINLPFVIDSIILPASSQSADLGDLKDISQNAIAFNKGKITLLDTKVLFPNAFSSPKQKVFLNDLVFWDFSVRIPFTLKRRVPVSIAKLLPNIFFPIPKQYSISQAEYDALTVLERLPQGKVLVYDKDCLDCSYETRFKPAAMAGKKNYVALYAKKPIIQDLTFLLSKTSQNAKIALQKTGVRYVFLSKYDDYIESLPYLPQDLGLKRVYQNANAEIWEVTSP